MSVLEIFTGHEYFIDSMLGFIHYSEKSIFLSCTLNSRKSRREEDQPSDLGFEVAWF